MFLKHTTVHGQDDCPIHGEAWHEYEFVRYNASKNRVVIRLRCLTCKEVKLNEWVYYEVSPQDWLAFLIGNHNNDFTGAS
jgi:hypothetical protein